MIYQAGNRICEKKKQTLHDPIRTKTIYLNQGNAIKNRNSDKEDYIQISSSMV